MHQVGQVLYVILTKKQKVIPIQITEQIVRRSIQGESIQYLVSVPGKNDSIDLKVLGNEIYSQLDQVEEALIKNANMAIRKMTEHAADMAQEHFMETPSTFQPIEHAKSNNESNNLQVTLENGTLANVSMNHKITELAKKKVIN
tara:strand:+ start:803 stop:1234 length:432 start_codon:yes stop_codon:yes gene_type:complete